MKYAFIALFFILSLSGCLTEVTVLDLDPEVPDLPSSEEAEAMMRAARNLVQQKQYKEAAEVFLNCSEKYPGTAQGLEAAFQAVTWLERAGELKRAENQLEKATALVPGHSLSRINSAASQANFMVAASYLKQATKQDSEGKPIDADLAKCVRYATASIKRDATGFYAAYAMLYLGQVAYRRGEFDVATDHFTKLLETFPHSPTRSDAYLWLAHSTKDRLEKSNGQRLADAKKLLELARTVLKEMESSEHTVKTSDNIDALFAEVEAEEADLIFEQANTYLYYSAYAAAGFYYRLLQIRYPSCRHVEDAARKFADLPLGEKERERIKSQIPLPDDVVVSGANGEG